MTTGVYEIRCLENGKQYIGSAIRIRARWAAHRHDLRCGRHHSGKLQNAWNKYGETAFEFAVLIVCERGIRRRYERDAIAKFDTVASGFNILRDTDGPEGHKHTAETRAKVRAARLGRKHRPETLERCRELAKSPEWIARMRAIHLGRRNSPETIEKMRAAASRRRCSEETKAKLREANTGRVMPDIHRQKISATLKGRPKSEAARANMRAAQQRIAAERRAMQSLGPA